MYDCRIALQAQRSLRYGHTYSKSTYQPGKVVNRARGELNRINEYSLCAFAPENLV